MREHTVSAFDDELAQLKGKVAFIGDQSRLALSRAVAALRDGDKIGAGAIVIGDGVIDTLAREVEYLAVQITAKRQPVAVDLREIFTAYRLSIDLERVGDLAKGIARRVNAMGDVKPHAETFGLLVDLAAKSDAALQTAIKAYRDEDATAAESVRTHDDAIDDLYSQASRALLQRAKAGDEDFENTLHLLFSAKNLERVGDHATNVAEAVLFLTSGDQPESDRPRAIDVP